MGLPQAVQFRTRGGRERRRGPADPRIAPAGRGAPRFHDAAPAFRPLRPGGAGPRPQRPGPSCAAAVAGRGFLPLCGLRRAASAAEAFDIAKKRADKDSSMTLDEWQAKHHDNVEAILSKLGFSDT